MREMHHWYEHLLRQLPDENARVPSKTETQVKMIECERRMRAITEQLYLQNPTIEQEFKLPSLAEIQGQLSADDLMIVYYNDGCHWWALAVTAAEIRMIPLEATIAPIKRLVEWCRRIYTAPCK